MAGQSQPDPTRSPAPPPPPRILDTAQPHNTGAQGGPTADLALVSGAEPVPGYVLRERLGKGGFGEVWKAQGPGRIDVALKFIRLDGQAGQVEQRALDLIKDVRHPNLLDV